MRQATPQQHASDTHCGAVSECTVAVLDTETTGLSRNDELIELAVIAFRMDLATGEVLEKRGDYCGLREPACPIHPAAASVNGLSIKDLRGKQLDHDAVFDLLNGVDLLIAHNASFDRRFLLPLFPELADKNWACSRYGVNWRSKGFRKAGLQGLLREHRISTTSAHRAMTDTRALIELLLFRDQQTGLPYLVELVAGSGRG